ncbi:MAG TPA: nucleoside phosphorylase [Stellaceae bacterium]|jgi:hopanoid-associated phosphorylase|nr:nucleoside phosphorylase [Stellaceae bacterium]
MTTFVVAGLEAEAKIARRAGLRTIVACGSKERRATSIAQAIADGATGLISFGIAGGLDPRLKPGTVLLPQVVHTEAGEAFVADAAWRHRMLAHVPDAVAGAIYGAEAVVARVSEKKSLFDRTQAVAVDLESAAVARAAARAGIPFIVLRTVADPAHRTLPQAAVFGLTGEGRVAYGLVFGHLARRPHQFPSLLFIAIETRRALTAIYAIAQPVDGFHALPVATAVSSQV